MINEYIINELSKKASLGKKLSLKYLSRLKRRAAKKIGNFCPTNIEILKTYRQMVKNGAVKPDKNIEKILVTKDIRTSSGVAIVAVLTKPYPCPGSCVYCPSEKNMPKSYLSNEPAVMRAILTKFNPYKQVEARLRSLEITGHKTDKIELIIMGGTFSYLPKKYQDWFVKECFRACNENKITNYKLQIKNKKLKNNNLEYLQKKNEKSAHRIVGLTLETRPDYINEKEILRMRKLGATRVELGVQSIYDDVLKLNKRGHGRKEIIEATKLLKEAGFKINYHIMPNLPGSSYKKDLEMFKELFSNPDFQPDMLKIYPCVVVKNAQIYKWWKQGKYKPYPDKKLISLLAEIKKTIPYYVRIARLVRDIPSTSIVAGNKISNLRQVLDKKSKEENWKCKCIRCREIRNKYKHREAVQESDIPLLRKGNASQLEVFRQDYEASGGKEIFLSFEDKDRKNLYSLLRLRINNDKDNFIPALKNAAIIREVHTYGQLVSIESKSENSPQHIGLGKKLIIEAENITKKEFGLKKIAAISGVGVRDYYRKLGYRLENGYMVKKLDYI